MMSSIGYFATATTGIAFMMLGTLDYMGGTESKAFARTNMMIGLLLLSACGYELMRWP